MREAEGIIERVSPRLQHANSAVVMSAVKVILRYMEEITNQEVTRTLSKKLAPPLVTLLNSEPEIQYVALRNINLIVLKRPKILEHEIKVFFCKYNDPIYVKMEKLEIIIRLASDRNIEQVLLELKEYATEVDVDFVRRAVRAIGRCAIKLDKSAERCINVLLDLIQTKVNYVVQEAIVVIKDIFRKYPNRYESIIATLCENLEDLDEPEAKASMVWIIGEYAERIDNADELLDSFLETFQEETATVQLQLLTATVKLFLKQPESAQETVQKVLTMATEESDNPDLRDRGYVYWRLLSSDPEAARAVVLAEKPEIGDDTFTLEPSLLDALIAQIGTLASVYHKPPEAFVMKTVVMSSNVEDDDEPEEESPDTEESHHESSAPSSGGAAQGGGNLLDFFDDAPEPVAPAAPKSSVKKISLVTAEAGHGVFISGAMVVVDGNINLVLDVGNASSTPVNALAIQFNKNTFGLAPKSAQLALPTAVSNGSSSEVTLGLAAGAQFVNPQEFSLTIQAAIKNMATGSVFYFTIPVSMECLFVATPAMDIGALATAWKSIEDSLDAAVVVNDLSSVDVDVIKGKLAPHQIAFVSKRDIPGQVGQSAAYFTCKTISNATFLVELKFKQGMNICKVTVKSPNKNLSELCKATVARLIV